MIQQINFYQAEFRTGQQIFSAITLLKASGVFVLAMLLAYLLSLQELGNIETELQVVHNEETAALERMHNMRPVISAMSGQKTWSERLEDATRLLEEKRLVISLVQGSELGDTQGFSRYLRSLARQDTDGLWLTYIGLSPLGDKTRMEGHALRAELVPAYLQRLAEEPPFATQRFHQFQIDGPEAQQGGIVTFSLNSESEFAAVVADSR